MTVQTLFSLLLYITFVLYFQMGIHILAHRKKASISDVILLICVAMSIWSFTFSISNFAQDYETALLWRRIATIGWGSIYALFLHFILVILGKPGFSKSKWFLGLLFIPALATIFIFGLHPTIAPGQYNLIHGISGWSNQSSNNYFDWLFNMYYLSYVISALLLIVFWGRRRKIINKKTSNLMFMTIAVTLLISTITDVVLSVYFPGNVPQIGPIILLIPVMSIYYSMRQQGLLDKGTYIAEAIEGHILNEISQRELYIRVSKSYMYAGFGTFAGFYFVRQESFTRGLIIGGSLFLVGLVVRLVNMAIMKAHYKDLMIAGVTSLNMLIFQFFFFDTAGMTAWVIPVVLIMMSILINNRVVLVMNSILAVLAVMIVGIKAPIITVFIKRSDHFVRVFLIVLFIFLANYIHEVFVKRLIENEDQVRRQKLISKISIDFTTLNSHNFEEKVQDSLKLFAEEFKIDRSYVYLLSEDRTKARCTNDICMSDLEYRVSDQVLDASNDPWWFRLIDQGKVMVVPDVSVLPLEALEEKYELCGYNLKSMLTIPIVVAGQPVGIVGFESIENRRVWEEGAVAIAGIIGRQCADAIGKMKSTEEIEYLAYYDILTGLPNRTLFNDRLAKEIKRCQLRNTIFGLLFLDLDAFKSINDTLGHEKGDELLINVADKISSVVRSYDTVSRFGGDEFLILATNLDTPEVLSHIADKLIKIFEQPIMISEHEFFITASIGISVYPEDGEDSVTLIKNADMAMYVSKDTGKNCYNFSSSLLKEDVLKKMTLTNSLYRALENQELEIYYQPQIDIASNKIVGLEALLRWHHQELGFVPPLDFIYLAEQTGLIIPIGEWVLATACHQNMLWQKMGLSPLRIAVNLSVEQFRHDQLVTSVEAILKETAMDPKYLELEITESIATKGTDHIISVLSRLKALGLSISIDDFGTEYSSLSRIKVMPIDRIKMDKNFVQGIANSSKDDAIVGIIIELAKSLDLNVIAEGVETEAQLDFLTHQSCDEVQGYYYYKPMPASEIEKVLMTENDKSKEEAQETPAY